MLHQLHTLLLLSTVTLLPLFTVTPHQPFMVTPHQPLEHTPSTLQQLEPPTRAYFVLLEETRPCLIMLRLLTAPSRASENTTPVSQTTPSP